jgi:hypothetical protein
MTRQANEAFSVTDGPSYNILDTRNFGSAGVNSNGSTRRVEIADNFDFNWGTKHQMRVGVLLDGAWYGSFDERNADGTWTYRNNEDYTANQPMQFSQRIGTLDINYSQFQGAFYWSDEYRIHRDLSLGFGVRNELQRGYIAGFPTINVHVSLVDGSYHDVDSSEHAFVAAGALAIREAFPKLGVVLLEPWMRVEVETPDEFTGSVMGSLQSKRAMITDTLKRGPSNIIICEVPLGEMFGYTTDLRSMSQGRASYSMEPSEYKQVPASMVEKLTKGLGRAKGDAKA